VVVMRRDRAPRTTAAVAAEIAGIRKGPDLRRPSTVVARLRGGYEAAAAVRHGRLPRPPHSDGDRWAVRISRSGTPISSDPSMTLHLFAPTPLRFACMSVLFSGLKLLVRSCYY